jgi:spermidine synthase
MKRGYPNVRGRLVLLCCFFLSGASGLVYEVVWTRKLALVFGSTSVSISLSLAAYLGGMALGAFLLGRVADRLKNPAASYGLLEIGIGAYGVVSLWVLDLVALVFVTAQGSWQLPGPLAVALQFGLVLLSFLLPTVLMGGSLPILVRSSHLGGAHLTTRVGALYAVNTVGAVVGTALGGLVLLPTFGLRASVLAAAMVNVALGLFVIGVLGRRVTLVESPEAAPPGVIPARFPSPSGGQLIVSILAFVSGASTLFYEVVWARALELTLGGSTRTFTLILMTFLSGLSAGIALGSWIARRSRRPLFGVVVVQATLGVSIFATAVLLRELPTWFVALYARIGGQPLLFTVSQGALCAVILFIPALLMGTIFPIAVELSQNGAGGAGGRVAKGVGRLFAINTAGCIVGALAAGLVLIPTVGMRRALFVGAWLNLALAAALGAQVPESTRRFRTTLAAAPLVVAGTLALATPAWDPMTMTTGVYAYAARMVKIGVERYHAAQAEFKLIYYREGPSGTVAVKEKGLLRVLSIDGRAEGNTNAIAQILLGQLPFALGRPIDDVFVIGWGTGTTAGALTLHPVRRVEAVEIEPRVIEASALFEAINHRPLDDARVSVRVNDARTVLVLSPPSSYDLIVSQPSTPWVPGASKLFTVEFYEIVHVRLRPGGVFAQWVQLYNIDRSSLAALLNTLTRVFPQALIVEVGGASGEVLFLATRDSIALSWPVLQRMFADHRLASELARVRVPNPGTLLSRVLLGPRELPALVAGARTNTDDNGLLEFSALATLYTDTTDANLAWLRGAAADPWAYVSEAPQGRARQPVLVEVADAALAAKEFQRGLVFARSAVDLGPDVAAFRTLGDLLYVTGQWTTAVEAWRNALALEPRDVKTLRRLVRHYSGLAVSARPPEYDAWVARLGAGFTEPEAPRP